MKLLSPTGFERAREYIYGNGRPLEQALFAHEFEDGSLEAVIREIAGFQNPDGGFGKALEPDVRTPTSSALCTEMGLRYLAERGVPASGPMVAAAVKYLLDSFDPASLVWRVIPEGANTHPHAPWWHDEDGSLARTFDDYLVIPRAGILALLYHYAEIVPQDWLAEVTDSVFRDIQSIDPGAFGGGGDTLGYTCRLAEAPGLPEEIAYWLESFVVQIADGTVARNPSQWTEYCAPPLKLAPRPDAITADELGDCIPAHQDYQIDQQSSDGYWDVTWSWGENYPENWAQAKTEWRGILTLDTLLSLRVYQRLP